MAFLRRGHWIHSIGHDGVIPANRFVPENQMSLQPEGLGSVSRRGDAVGSIVRVIDDAVLQTHGLKVSSMPIA